MEEYVVYTLASAKTNKLYKGYTSDLTSRFASHNGLSNKGWTIRFRPLRVVFVRFYSNKADGIKFEKFLKSGSGRNWIRLNVPLY